jgi:putative addiction module component (TIGR02574 family)
LFKASRHQARLLSLFLDEAFRSRYCFAMSTEQLIADAMALPLSERVSLAQALWESIEAGLPDADERAAVAEAIRRDKELSSGRVAGRTHEEVMQAARRALECD